MSTRTMRYLLADLSAGTVEAKEAAVPERGSVCAFVAFLEGGASEDLMLVTGPLCGCGAPGSGLFAWISPEGSLHYAEGRLGAALRLAGMDALLLRGRAEQPGLLYIKEGKASLEEMPASPGALRDRHETEHSLLLWADEEGLWEEGEIPVGDAALSRELQVKGLFALAVEAAGALPVADPEGLLALCKEMYRALAAAEEKARRGESASAVGVGTSASAVGAETSASFVPFLAVGATAEECAKAYREPAEDALPAAEMGLYIRTLPEGEDPKSLTEKLLRCVLGEEAPAR